MNITLTERQCDQLAALKRLRELCGRPEFSDEEVASIALSRGLRNEIDDNQFLVDLDMPALLARQAV